MFFSSLIAENASRKIRLVFPTPSSVPVPSKEGLEAEIDPIAMFDLIRFPSWMENKEDPFSADLLRPVISSSSFSTISASSGKSFSSSDSTVHFEDRTELFSLTEAIAPSEESIISGAQAGPEGRADTHADDKEPKSLTTATSSSRQYAAIHSQVFPRSRYKHSSLPANFRFVPMTTILLAGGNAMPLLSALTNLPDTPYRLLANRRPRSSIYDDQSTALSESSSAHVDSSENISTNSCDQHMLSELQLLELHIPQSPFDPFGSLDMPSPNLMNNEIEKAGSSRMQENYQEHMDKFGTSGGNSAESNHSIDGQTHADAVTETEDRAHCADENAKAVDNAHKRPPLGVLSSYGGKATGLDASVLRPSRMHTPKPLGTFVEIRTPSHHISLIDLRPQSRDLLENIPREIRGGDLSPPISIPKRSAVPLVTPSDVEGNGSRDETHTSAAQHAQVERVPVTSSRDAKPASGGDSSSGLSSADTTGTDGCVSPKDKSSSTKRFRRSVMGKLKKLAHMKKSSAH